MLWKTWFLRKYLEMMVLPVNFTKFFGLNSKPLCYCPIKKFLGGELNISQKQAIIKLIEKKKTDKRMIKNWRPISLLKGLVQ